MRFYEDGSVFSLSAVRPPEKGTLRTVYINLDQIRNDFRFDNLKWAFETILEGTDFSE